MRKASFVLLIACVVSCRHSTEVAAPTPADIEPPPMFGAEPCDSDSPEEPKYIRMLPALDSELGDHPLFEVAFARDCKRVAVSCRHACVVERRRDAAPIVFARAVQTIRLMEQGSPEPPPKLPPLVTASRRDVAGPQGILTPRPSVAGVLYENGAKFELISVWRALGCNRFAWATIATWL
jgi:hypothetical protein